MISRSNRGGDGEQEEEEGGHDDKVLELRDCVFPFYIHIHSKCQVIREQGLGAPDSSPGFYHCLSGHNCPLPRLAFCRIAMDQTMAYLWKGLAKLFGNAA